LTSTIPKDVIGGGIGGIEVAEPVARPGDEATSHSKSRKRRAA
jgi:hypothetical protein